MIITVCGSSRFKKEILQVARDLTIQGNIVLAPFVFHHAEEEELPREVLIQLDNLHKEKIEMSDAIFVVNINKYIGESTFGEIDWAQRKKKQVYFLEPMEDAIPEDAPVEKLTETVEPITEE
jgi:hypothetical protein